MTPANPDEPKPMPTDQDWGLVLLAMEIPIGAPVCVRTVDDGVAVGILRCASGYKVGLTNVFTLHSWSGTGRPAGSVSDMLDNAASLVIRCAVRPKRIIDRVSSMDEITMERYRQLAASPRA